MCSLFSKQPFRFLFCFTAAGVKCHVVAVKILPVLHHCAAYIFIYLFDFIFFFFFFFFFFFVCVCVFFFFFFFFFFFLFASVNYMF